MMRSPSAARPQQGIGLRGAFAWAVGLGEARGVLIGVARDACSIGEGTVARSYR